MFLQEILSCKSLSCKFIQSFPYTVIVVSWACRLCKLFNFHFNCVFFFIFDLAPEMAHRTKTSMPTLQVWYTILKMWYDPFCIICFLFLRQGSRQRLSGRWRQVDFMLGQRFFTNHLPPRQALTCSAKGKWKLSNEIINYWDSQGKWKNA